MMMMLTDAVAQQAAGVAKTAPRHEWPVAVLQQVVGGLMREAPRQLLARELWAGSGSAASWWRRQHLFVASTAVMSMVKRVYRAAAMHSHCLPDHDTLASRASGHVSVSRHCIIG